MEASLSLDSGGNQVEAVRPRVPVQSGSKVEWEGLQKFVTEDIEIFAVDLSLDVLRLQMSELGVQRIVVPKQTDCHVQTAEHTFGMGLEFGGIHIVTTDSGKQAPGSWIVSEKVVEESDGEVNSMGARSKRFRPLVLDLETLQNRTVGTDVPDRARKNCSDQQELHGC
jgi:hypothetical protein